MPLSRAGTRAPEAAASTPSVLPAMNRYAVTGVTFDLPKPLVHG
jgi:hypothetical protein